MPNRLSLLLLAAALSLACGRNLVNHATFAVRTEEGQLPPKWSRRNGAARFTAAVDRATTFRGAASLRPPAPPDTPPDTWNMVSYRLPDLRRATPYSVSLMVRTADLGPDALAYASLNCFSGGDAARRLAANDSPRKLDADSDWTPLSFTVPELPPGTARAELVLCLKGAGTAWFTQLQVEHAPSPTPFHLADDDQRLLDDLRRHAESRAAWKARNLARRRHPQREAIAILDLGLPAQPGPAGHPSSPHTIRKALADHYDAVLLSADDLALPGLLDARDIRLLIVPSGNLFPLAAADALTHFLASGGQLLTCGGYAFDQPAIRLDGEWQPAGKAPRLERLDQLGQPAPYPLPKAQHWLPSSNPDSSTRIQDATGPAPETAAIHVATDSLSGWNNAILQLEPSRLPPHWNALAVRVRALTPHTTHAWLELSEADGSRWHTKLTLTPQWQDIILTADQFTYWHDNPSVGRGGRGDFLNPQAATQLQFGIAIDCAAPGKPHAVQLADLRLGNDPHHRQRTTAPPQINTRDGRIRDAIHPEDHQLGVFDPAFRLLNATSAHTTAIMRGILPDIRLDGPFSGLSAVAQLGVNGHGFGPNRASWRPLLEATDDAGQPRGHLGALVHHTSGTFRGSSWAIFGVDNRDLFAEGSPLLQTLLLPTVDLLMRRVALSDTATGYACYRPGETIDLQTQVANFSAQPIRAQLRFTLADELGKTVLQRDHTQDVPPNTVQPIRLPCQPPAHAPDYLTLTAELRVDGQLLDREESAVCIWNERTLAQGPTIRRNGTHFTIDGRTRFLMGCQTFWGQHQSVTASSPLMFYRDFSQMRAHGLRWTRCFLPSQDERQRRISDAIVLLAQKFGIVLYHTPNLGNMIDEKALQEETARITDIARRYADVPGLAIDLCNEPQLRLDRSPALEALLGHAPKLRGPWNDWQVHHTYATATDVQRRWARRLATAARKPRLDRLISVGWSQGWAGGNHTKDPQAASLDLDFTDRHYYGPYTRMMPQIKDLDLRVLDKPVIVGECGAKCHPTFLDHDPWGHGNDDRGYDERFRYLVSHAFGNGCAALLSWHWRDPMEGIFPCGLVLSTGVPRPTAATFASMARAFGQLELAANAPDTLVVMGDWLRHTERRPRAIAATHHADEALLWLGANYSKLTERALEQAIANSDSPVRAILFPAAFVLSEATVTALEKFVRRGGRLWLSGNPQFDGDGHRHPEWLQRLCGVAPAPNGLDTEPFAADLPARQGDGHHAGQTIRPTLDVLPRGATVIATADGKPFLTTHVLGRGSVTLCTALLEDTAPQSPQPLRDAYQTLLADAQAAYTRRLQDPESLETFRVPGQGATGWVFWNGGQTTITTERGGHALTLKPKQAGYLQVADDGSLQLQQAW